MQDFIAAARSTRDLWSGSYLLSWLMAAGIAECIKSGGKMVFPSPEGQPLIDFHSREPVKDRNGLLTPNLPNLFVARVPKDKAANIGEAVAKAIRDEWRAIADSVWAKHDHLRIEGAKTEFDEQVAHFLSISWIVTPETDDYAKDYDDNARMLDAVRQTRDFAAMGTGEWTFGAHKDSLNGKDAAIAGGKDFEAQVNNCYKHLFRHDDDHLGAITLIKRIWHETYLHGKQQLPASSGKMSMPNTRDIAAGRPNENTADDKYKSGFGEGDEKYFAVIALDGDRIGKWISGEFTDKTNLAKHHTDFSKALSDFALKRARNIVISEPYKGRLIYAGGDDVLALLPAVTALACAQELKKEFEKATKEIQGTIPKPKEGETPSKKTGQRPGDPVHPTCSVGLAIGHYKAPLQDMVREAQAAEKRAKKGDDGRNAFSISLMKRSGEIIHWTAKWDSGAAELHDKLVKAMKGKILSAKWPHVYQSLLEPYRNTGMGDYAKTTPVPGFDAAEIARRELPTVMERQRGDKWRDHKTEAEALQPAIEDYIEKLKEIHGIDKPDAILDDLIGLLRTVAFVAR